MKQQNEYSARFCAFMRDREKGNWSKPINFKNEETKKLIKQMLPLMSVSDLANLLADKCSSNAVINLNREDKNYKITVEIEQ